MKVAQGEMKLDDTSKLYWAAGEDATVSFGDYSGESAMIDLSNSNFNDTSRPSFYGDIQAVDATGYAGEATLIGNGDVDNILTGGSGNSSLWGGYGAGNDTLIGGEGNDMFWYAHNSGDDVIEGATENDIVRLENIKLDELTATGNDLFVEGTNDVKFELKDGGTLTVKDAKTSGVVFDVQGTKYAVNKDSGEWEYK